MRNGAKESKKILLGCMIASVLVVVFFLSSGFSDPLVKVRSVLDRARDSGLAPLPSASKLVSMQKDLLATSRMTKEQVELGKILYFDPRLSGDKLHSCNSCHNISLFGTSYTEAANNPQHLAVPTIFNAMFNDSLYYRGRINKTDKADKNTTKFDSKHLLSRAALRSLSAKNEMNSDPFLLARELAKSSEYASYFKRAYGSKVKISPELIAESLASFILTLNTFSRYDDFLAGNIKALSLEEIDGLEVFIERGCVSCHNGINLGGNMQPFEVLRDYKFKNIGEAQVNEDSLMKVPTLRNVTATAPYFYNGALDSLEDAIKEMGRIQLGVDLSNKDIKKLVTFFQSLKGVPEAIELPLLPSMR